MAEARFDDDQALSLNELSDLMARIEVTVTIGSDCWRVLRAVMEWGGDHQLFTWAEPGTSVKLEIDRIVPSSAEIRRMADGVGSRANGKTDPAGPQASSGKPDAKAAGDLNAVADRPGSEVKALTDGEACLPGADDPSAPPVAGGGASAKPALPARWTEEEDARAIALAVAGQSALHIAMELGRPVPGTAFRLKNALKDRIKAAKVAAGENEEGTASGGKDPAEDPPAAAGNAAETAPAAPAPPFDISRPAWWKQATADLNALGYRRPFTAAVDLQLVEEFVRGTKADVLEADMQIGALDLKNRWRALLSCLDVPEGYRPTIEDQTRLLHLLRHRAGVASAAS